MTKLILIRHGESTANRKGVFAGQIDPDLQHKGFKQATLTAEFIAQNYKVDKIYSSDLKRAFQTALCLGKRLGLEVATSKNLREIFAGKWENLKFTDIATLYRQDFSVWLNDIGKAVCTGGESVKELGERIMGELTKIAQENAGKTIAIGTHATPIRVALTLAQYGDLAKMQSVPWVSNASVTEFVYDGEKFSVTAVSLDKHLEELKTDLPSNV